MSLAPEPPAPLIERLERLALADLLTGFVARERVGVQFLRLERFAASHGYQFEREGGDLYGRLRLIPTPPATSDRVTIRFSRRLGLILKTSHNLS